MFVSVCMCVCCNYNINIYASKAFEERERERAEIISLVAYLSGHARFVYNSHVRAILNEECNRTCAT